jgi:hypothetical protein
MDKSAVELASGAQPTVNDKDIKMDVLIDEFKLAKDYVYQYTREFQQLDDLVDGVPVHKQEDTPFVGDTTLGSLVRSIPRQSLQQLPVFSAIVNGTKNSIQALVCSFLLKKTAFNEDTFGKGLLSTLQLGTEQAITHGYAPFMVATGQMYNDFGTTMRLLHFSDTAPEPGVTDANESGYHYVVANLTPSRVRKILKTARKNPNTTWDVKMLELVLEAAPRAKTYSIYESAARMNVPGEQMGPTYEFVTRSETGPDSTTITFCPEVSDGPLRVMESKSKWGYPRVHYLVVDPAALTPFGVSRVRLASPNTNLLNIYYGNIASMLLLNSKPPIMKRGRFLKPVTLSQGAVWETNDPQADAKLVNLDNGALEHFVTFQQQLAAQVQNIMSATMNGTASDGGLGKTAPGVKQQGEIMSVNTNQITKILENFLRQYALVALDTLLSEQTGDDTLIVDDVTKNAINTLAQQDFKPVPDPQTGQPTSFVPPIGADNKMQMVWEDFYAAIEEWSVEISVSISKDEMEEKKRGDLQDMLVVLAQNAAELGPGAVAKVQEITDMLMQDIAPDVAPLPITGAPPPPPPTGPGQTATGGGKVMESADLVKLFGSVTDPNVRNAILHMLGLPPEQTPPTPPAPVAPAPEAPTPDPMTVTPDHLIRGSAEDHKQAMDKAKLALEVHKTLNPPEPKAPLTPQP